MQMNQGPVVENLAVFTTKRFRGKLTVTEYVDVTTGEILPAELVQKMGVRVIRPDASLRRVKKLDSLRKEPREFADFILQFRDRLCGFLAPLDTLIGWYAQITGKQASHVRRYFRPLILAGVFDTASKLNEDFMIHNPFAGKKEAKGAECRAYNIFDSIRNRREV